jgi:hypothetical protein
MRHRRVNRVLNNHEKRQQHAVLQTQQECSSVPDAGLSRTAVDICDQPDRAWQIKMSRNCKSPTRGFNGARDCSISIQTSTLQYRQTRTTARAHFPRDTPSLLIVVARHFLGTAIYLVSSFKIPHFRLIGLDNLGTALWLRTAASCDRLHLVVIDTARDRFQRHVLLYLKP